MDKNKKLKYLNELIVEARGWFVYNRDEVLHFIRKAKKIIALIDSAESKYINSIDIYNNSDGSVIKTDWQEHIVTELEMLKIDVENEPDAQSGIIIENMKVFISYSSDDKIIAGKIKAELEEDGFDAFLAHEDIEPAEEWESVIRENLLRCSILIPILTDNFEKSKWTNQEVGFVLARNKLIVPLKITTNPPGFISRLQALSISALEKFPLGKFRSIITNTDLTFGNEYRKKAIELFGKSLSYVEGGKHAERLVSLSGFTQDDIKLIVDYYLKNEQLHKGHLPSQYIVPFLRSKRDMMDDVTYSKFVSTN